MLYTNTPSPEYNVQNPLATTIKESESIIQQLQQFSELLENAINEARENQGFYRDALDAYTMAETEELYEVVMMAQQKEGPLAGLATSSEAYKIAMSHLKNNLRMGILAHFWQDAERYRQAHEMTQVELEQANTRFSALRRIAELKAQILRASTI